MGAVTGVNAAGKVGQRVTGRLAGFREGQGRIPAQHDADGVRLAWQPPHDVERDYPAVGDPDAEAGEGGIPYGNALASRCRLKRPERAISQ